MVKETTVPSGSVPPRPGMLTLCPGDKVTLVLLATGGWLAFGTIGSSDAVAGAGLMAPRLSVAV